MALSHDQPHAQNNSGHRRHDVKTPMAVSTFRNQHSFEAPEASDPVFALVDDAH